MEIQYYQVDAFTSKPFFGNPAAVCPLHHWLEDPVMQLIAFENNMNETAFMLDMGDHYELRWFTPKVEVDLCGHATLASAFVIFEYLDCCATRVEFRTKSGMLSVEKDEGGLMSMDFPSLVPAPSQVPEQLVAALGKRPKEVLVSTDIVAVYDSPEDVMDIIPDMRLLSRLDADGVIVTAPGADYDFISRCFAPKVGIPEDPVTGSAHCSLTPYWAGRLGKNELHAFQASQRGGELFCELKGDRVKISGHAVCYLKGTIAVSDLQCLV